MKERKEWGYSARRGTEGTSQAVSNSLTAGLLHIGIVWRPTAVVLRGTPLEASSRVGPAPGVMLKGEPTGKYAGREPDATALRSPTMDSSYGSDLQHTGRGALREYLRSGEVRSFSLKNCGAEAATAP